MSVHYMESLGEIQHRHETGKPRARPTKYKGIQFRSRLEVRFASHLDDLGERWLYEPRAYGPKSRGYLPDFQIIGAVCPTFIEVKPTIAEAVAAREKVAVIWETVPDAVILIAAEEGCTFSCALKDVEWVTWQERWT